MILDSVRNNETPKCSSELNVVEQMESNVLTSCDNVEKQRLKACIG